MLDSEKIIARCTIKSFFVCFYRNKQMETKIEVYCGLPRPFPGLIVGGNDSEVIELLKRRNDSD